MIRRPPRSTLDRSSAASDVYKRQGGEHVVLGGTNDDDVLIGDLGDDTIWGDGGNDYLSLIHISEPTRPY